MHSVLEKFAAKMVESGLAEQDAPLLAAMDDELYWNRPDPLQEVLSGLFERLNISSLVWCEPAEPYRSVLAYLDAAASWPLAPRDTETRLFLHEIPRVGRPDLDELTSVLAVRKSAVVGGRAIVSTGAVTPEQAFVVFSSVCFASSVKVLSDALSESRKGPIDGGAKDVVEGLVSRSKARMERATELERGPLRDEASVLEAVFQAGRAVVDAGLVDSYFGNVSYRLGNVLYISQTGASLDELEGHVDPCPLDGSSSAAITASSELPAHLKVAAAMGEGAAVLHGHPMFSVAMSMDCQLRDTCPNRERCHTHCDHERFLGPYPIVPGEVGAGPRGLHRTLPPVLESHPAAVVYGHGVFSVGKGDFVNAFAELGRVERGAVQAVEERVLHRG